MKFILYSHISRLTTRLNLYVIVTEHSLLRKVRGTNQAIETHPQKKKNAKPREQHPKIPLKIFYTICIYLQIPNQN